MLINLRNALMSGKRMPTAKDYVQDGLVAMWDGIENAGWGVHDPNATTWKDLVSGNDFNFVNTPTWRDNAFISGESWLRFNASDIDGLVQAYNGGEFTFQFVLDYDNELYPTTNFPMFFGSIASTVRLYCISRGMAGGWWYSNGYAYNRPLTKKCATYVADGNSSFKYYDGTTVQTSASSTTVRGSVSDRSPFYIGRADYNAGDNTRYIGPICSVRLYSRALTANKIAANYAIDKARFNLP